MIAPIAHPDRMRAEDLVDILSGGDLRSIGRASEVVEGVLADPALFRALVAAMTHDDPVVRARAADAAEKVTADRPDLLESVRSHLLGDLAAIKQQEVRWHVAAMVSRLEFTDAEADEASALLRGFLDDDSRIVRVMTMQALADLTLQHPALRGEVQPLLERLTENGTAAIRARGRKLLAELDRAAEQRRQAT